MKPLAIAFATILASGEAPAGTGLGRAAKALEDRNPGDAIAELERLADEGVVDANASFDRGIAYAMRSAIDPRPGDLGRAIHGFEEAADLAGRGDLEKTARITSRSIKQEVAKRNSRAGVTVGVEPSRSVDRAVARALPENAWAAATLMLSWVTTLAIGFALWGKRRSSAVVLALSTVTAGAFCAMCTWFARRERLEYQEGIVIAELAHPEDESRKNIPMEYPLPEGTRLLIVDEAGARVKVRLVSRDAWVSRTAVLPLTKPR